MIRTPFAVYRQIRLAIGWYGTEYDFNRRVLNAYGEPTTEEPELVQSIAGIYHSSERSFIELINNEGASVKSKVSRGIVCDADVSLSIQQNDHVVIEDKDFYVTAVEPVLYGDKVVAYEISVEEVLSEKGDS